MNFIHVIHPYKEKGQWKFDDERNGLKQEPFVSGADELMDKMVSFKQIHSAEKGFTIIFAARPFPDFDFILDRDRFEHGGTWYFSVMLNQMAWLCPALLKYFSDAPITLYLQVIPLANQE